MKLITPDMFNCRIVTHINGLSEFQYHFEKNGNIQNNNLVHFKFGDRRLKKLEPDTTRWWRSINNMFTFQGKKGE